MKLRRSSSDRVIAGVCGGIAETIGTPAKNVRFVFVLLILFAGLSGWTYLLAWLLMPPDFAED